MNKILICEICREPIARFNIEDMTLPINLQAFKSLYPERAVPDPGILAHQDFSSHSDGRFLLEHVIEKLGE